MPTDWLGGDNPSVLVTCLLTAGLATAVMYVCGEFAARRESLADHLLVDATAELAQERAA